MACQRIDVVHVGDEVGSCGPGDPDTPSPTQLVLAVAGPGGRELEQVGVGSLCPRTPMNPARTLATVHSTSNVFEEEEGWVMEEGER